ncbi:hypothetical protein QG516_20740 [Pedobacter gandavensis]|uniref:hypothetical protein n=1 Tax=Pedobacter gandavensis TaxID=2679963 RepID=UPI00247B1F43|nr:hypothetical protein [Pedobacter gandavensis]WGQ08943.1 hypothetical protein QG516_20740 [Pedobacter gandavensis]
MAGYFYKGGLKEIETSSVITIKSGADLQIENLSKERLGLGKMAEEYNNQVILVNLLEDAVQSNDLAV